MEVEVKTFLYLSALTSQCPVASGHFTSMNIGFISTFFTTIA